MLKMILFFLTKFIKIAYKSHQARTSEEEYALVQLLAVQRSNLLDYAPFKKEIECPPKRTNESVQTAAVRIMSYALDPPYNSNVANNNDARQSSPFISETLLDVEATSFLMHFEPTEYQDLPTFFLPQQPLLTKRLFQRSHVERNFEIEKATSDGKQQKFFRSEPMLPMSQDWSRLAAFRPTQKNTHHQVNNNQKSSFSMMDDTKKLFGSLPEYNYLSPRITPRTSHENVFISSTNQDPYFNVKLTEDSRNLPLNNTFIPKSGLAFPSAFMSPMAKSVQEIEEAEELSIIEPTAIASDMVIVIPPTQENFVSRQETYEKEKKEIEEFFHKRMSPLQNGNSDNQSVPFFSLKLLEYDDALLQRNIVASSPQAKFQTISKHGGGSIDSNLFIENTMDHMSDLPISVREKNILKIEQLLSTSDSNSYLYKNYPFEENSSRLQSQKQENQRLNPPQVPVQSKVRVNFKPPSSTQTRSTLNQSKIPVEYNPLNIPPEKPSQIHPIVKPSIDLPINDNHSQATPRNFHEILPNGSVVYFHYREHKDLHGAMISIEKDPIVCTVDPNFQQDTYTYPNGQTEIYYHSKDATLRHKVVFRDGTVIERFKDGNQVIKYRDGTEISQPIPDRIKLILFKS